MSHNRHTTLLLCAMVVTLVAIRCRRCADLSAHDWVSHRHEPYTSVRETGTHDPYCARLSAEATMLRAAGR